MKHTIYIGESVHKALTGSAKVKALCADRVFPIVATEGAKTPFLTYTRDTVIYGGTKDGKTEDSVSYSVNIVTATYYDGLTIADAVIDTLLAMPAPDAETEFDTILSGASESFVGEEYVQTLTFTTTVNHL